MRRFSAAIMAKVCGFMTVGCAAVGVVFSTATPAQAFGWNCPEGYNIDCPSYSCRFGAYECSTTGGPHPVTGQYVTWCIC